VANGLSRLLLSVVLSLYIVAAQASDEKILYHLHGSDPETLYRSITNLENLIKGMPGQQLDIRLLLQGESIQLFNPYMHHRQITQRLQVLQNNGIKIEVQQENYLRNKQFLDEEFSPVLVNNVFSRIIELQRLGYHYISS